MISSKYVVAAHKLIKDNINGYIVDFNKEVIKEKLSAVLKLIDISIYIHPFI